MSHNWYEHQMPVTMHVQQNGLKTFLPLFRLGHLTPWALENPIHELSRINHQWRFHFKLHRAMILQSCFNMAGYWHWFAAPRDARGIFCKPVSGNRHNKLLGREHLDKILMATIQFERCAATDSHMMEYETKLSNAMGWTIYPLEHEKTFTTKSLQLWDPSCRAPPSCILDLRASRDIIVYDWECFDLR